jgi:hypothetical protein
MKLLTIVAAATLASGALLGTPSQADPIRSGTTPQPIKQTGSVNPPKSIDSPGGQSGGGIKSAPFNPVTVTFPNNTTSRSQTRGGGTANRSGGGQRR